jgi:hypothetical protein
MDEEALLESSAQWAIIEVMGHGKAAGRYCVENGLHRVDIPQEDGSYHTKYYGNGAIFCITMVDEAAARLVAKQLRATEQQPIGVWSLRQELKRLQTPAGPKAVIDAEYPGQYDSYEEYDDGDDDNYEDDLGNHPQDDDECPF